MDKFIRQLALVLRLHNELQEAMGKIEYDHGYFLYNQQQEYEKELGELEAMFKELV